jgi:hypothetical protein
VALFALLPPSVKELTAKKVGILFVSGARSVGKSSLAGAKSAARKTKAAHAQRKSESKNQVQDEETAP